MRKNILLLLSFVFFATITLFAAPNQPKKYALEKGLSLYILETTESPLIQIEYVVKAGTSRQKPDTTGFYQLYARLFWTQTQKKNQMENLGASQFEALCNQGDSRFSFTCPPTFFSENLSLFAEMIEFPSFSISEITEKRNALQKEVSDFSSSLTGFINSTINTALFPTEPWKQDSGVYPALFASISPEETAGQLNQIHRSYYTPQNSAIFITGPVNAEAVLSEVKTIFAQWENTKLGTTKITNTISKEDTPLQKKYLLVSPQFSPDLHQIILQYASENHGDQLQEACSIFAANSLLENPKSKIKEDLLLSSQTGIPSSDYLYSSFTTDTFSTRLSIQSLNNNNTPALQQAKAMVESLSSIAPLSLEEKSYITNKATNQYLQLHNSGYTYMKALAANWAYGAEEYINEFYERLQKLEDKEYLSTFEKEPFVFILINEAEYKKTKSLYEKEEYQIVFPESKRWYENQRFFIAEDQDNNVPKDITTPQFSLNTTNMSHEVLSNNIPLLSWKNPNTETITISLLFSQGETVYSADKRGLQTIVIKGLASAFTTAFQEEVSTNPALELPSVSSSTNLYSSQITVSCLAKDFDTILPLMSKVLLFGSIIPSQGDELFYNENYEWRIRSAKLDFQLTCTGLAAIYSGYKEEEFFSIANPILEKVDFNSIQGGYTNLLDASNLSILLSGAITEEKKSMINHYFGLLRQLGKTEEPKEEKYISLPNMELSTRIRHTFTTDIPAELAGSRPTNLIPTTDFTDPGQVYIMGPGKNNADYPLYETLLSEFCKELDTSLKHLSKTPAEGVSYYVFDTLNGNQSIGIITFEKIHNKENTKLLFSQTQQVFAEKFSQEITIPYLQAQGIQLLFSQQPDTLIHNFLLTGTSVRNPSMCFNWYNTLLFATGADYDKTMKYITSPDTMFWLFSAYSK